MQKTPASFRQRGFRFHQIKSLAVTYFHIDKVDTSIGAERFHFRVRKGIGWFPLAMAARQTGCKGAESWLSPFTNSYNLFRRLVAFKSSIDTHTRFDPVENKSKSLGCYMVKPHGQLVLVS